MFKCLQVRFTFGKYRTRSERKFGLKRTERSERSLEPCLKAVQTMAFVVPDAHTHSTGAYEWVHSTVARKSYFNDENVIAGFWPSADSRSPDNAIQLLSARKNKSTDTAARSRQADWQDVTSRRYEVTVVARLRDCNRTRNRSAYVKK